MDKVAQPTPDDRQAGPILDAEALVSGLVRDAQLRAGGFIVTIYGDVVEPRGDRVWIGNIIETCASVGISETLVRTAVSRLVAAGRLAGERNGRRSYYRLTRVAREEFLSAARTLFEAPARDGWSFVWLPAGRGEEMVGALERLGFARISGQWLVGPRHAPTSAVPGIVFTASTEAEAAMLRVFAAEHWNLATHAAAYGAFLLRFAALEEAIRAGVRLTPAQSLQIRLLLVHLYRQAALRDPRLPEAALPEDWGGHRARRLFARLYLALSPAADSYVARHFVSVQDALPATTAATEQRLLALARAAERPAA